MSILKSRIGYGYNDVTIVPKRLSYKASRSECHPFDDNGYLPLFTAPMATVVNVENFELWEKNYIYPILPRNIDYNIRLDYFKQGKWVAFSLSETENIINMFSTGALSLSVKGKICIDIANGHMNRLIQLCKRIKSITSDIEIMTGNIANYETYKEYCDAKIDYVRVSIGSGAGCTTSSNTGIHYPIASLLDEINQVKGYTKVIADGGIRNYSDVIKALALGADYVMVGGLFSSFLESAAPMKSLGDVEFKNNMHHFSYMNFAKPDIAWSAFLEDFNNYKQIQYLEEETEDNLVHTYLMLNIWDINTSEDTKRFLIKYFNNKCQCIEKSFFGMSTKIAQKMIKDSSNLKTSEGTTKKFYVNYTMKQWVDNMIDYLRSAMSYCNSHNLKSFIGNQDLIVNSLNETNAVNK